MSLAIIVYLSPAFSLGPRYVPVTRPVPPAAGLFIMRIERAEGDKDPVRSFSPIHPLSPIPWTVADPATPSPSDAAPPSSYEDNPTTFNILPSISSFSSPPFCASRLSICSSSNNKQREYFRYTSIFSQRRVIQAPESSSNWVLLLSTFFLFPPSSDS